MFRSGASIVKNVKANFTSMIKKLDVAIGKLAEDNVQNNAKINDLYARQRGIDATLREAQSFKGKLEDLIGG